MCKSCEVLNINGMNCHETGCPEARKVTRHCDRCGELYDVDPWSNGVLEGEQYCSQNCAEMAEEEAEAIRRDLGDGYHLTTNNTTEECEHCGEEIPRETECVEHADLPGYYCCEDCARQEAEYTCVRLVLEE